MATVQGSLEAALAPVAAHPVALHCAGRTDAGVHATAQVAHFDAAAERPERAWVRGSDAHLDAAVRVLWAKAVPRDFHARHSALARRYRYVFHDRERPSPLLARRVCWSRRPLDAARMHAGAQVLLGEHDFSSFRAAGCQAPTAVRRVRSIAVRRAGAFVVLDIEANAFLLHMVRNIAGALRSLGTGDVPEPPAHWLRALLETRDRTQAPATAIPAGLYLTGVRYAPRWNLPGYDDGPDTPAVLPF